jgi:hypothetical protein
LRPMNSLVFRISQIRFLQYCETYFMRLRPFKPFRRLAKALCREVPAMPQQTRTNCRGDARCTHTPTPRGDTADARNP